MFIGAECARAVVIQKVLLEFLPVGFRHGERKERGNWWWFGPSGH